VRVRIVRAIAAVLVAALLLAFGIIQAASDSLNATVAVPQSLPHEIPPAFGLRIYRVLDRIAPSVFVETTLAHYELEHGDLGAALRYAVRLPPIAERNELLGRIALADGDRVLALEYFFAAPDIAALQREVAGIAKRDPPAAYAYEVRVLERLAVMRTHPDAVAEAYYTMGVLASEAGYCFAPRSTARDSWMRRGLRDALAAARLAPLSEKYLLEVAAVELNLGNRVEARHWYERVLRIDPGSAAARNELHTLEARRRT
jgi:tetratricopeptide (TPR) repeat protein